MCDMITANLLSVLAITLARGFQKKMETLSPPHYEKRSGPPTQTKGDQQLQGHHEQTSIDPGSR